MVDRLAKFLRHPAVREGIAWLVFALIAILATTLLFLPGCNGQLAFSGRKPLQRPFTVLVRNNDPTYPETLTVSWWVDSTVVGSRTVTVGPGATAAVPCHGPAYPLGFSVEGTAWPNGVSWSGPDFSGSPAFQVEYPQWPASRRIP